MLEIQVGNESQADSNLLDPAYSQFRDQTRFWIQRVAVPLIMVIGLFGNLITVIIMTRRRMRSTTNLYLAALAFVDMLYLVLTFLLGLSHYPNMAAIKYYLYWQLRPFLMMLTDACSNTSVWLTVTFTIERYIAVRYPMKGKVWCTEARAKKLIIFVFAFGLIFASPVPFEWRVIKKTVPIRVPELSLVNSSSVNSNRYESVEHTLFDNDGSKLQAKLSDESSLYIHRNTKKEDDIILVLENTDFGRNETYKTIYYWSTAVIFYFIPLISLTLFNTFLIKSVHQSQRERSRMTHQPQHSSASLDKQQQQQPQQFLTDPNGKNQLAKRQSSFRNISKYSINCRYLTKKNHMSKLGLNLWKSLGGGGGDASSPVDHVCVSPMVSRDLIQVPDKRTNELKSIASSPPILIVSKQRDNDIENSMPSNLSHTKSVPIADDGVGNNYKNFASPLIVNCRQLFTGHVCQSAGANRLDVHNPNNHHLKPEQAFSATLTTDTNLDTKGARLDRYLETKSLTFNCDKKIDPSDAPADCRAVIWKRTGTVNSSSAELLSARREAVETAASRNFSQDQTMDRNKSILQANSIEVLSTETHDIDASSNHLQCPAGSSGTIGGYCGSSSCSGSAIVSRDSHQHHSSTSNQERHITIMLIAVVILFLICQIPSAAMLLYSSVHEPIPNTNEHALVLAFGNIFNFLMAINAAGNFILYSFLSKKYRRTFMILFCNCFESWSRVHTNQEQRSKLLQQQLWHPSAYNNPSHGARNTNIRFCQTGQQTPFKNNGSINGRDTVLVNSGSNVGSTAAPVSNSFRLQDCKQRRDTLV